MGTYTDFGFLQGLLDNATTELLCPLRLDFSFRAGFGGGPGGAVGWPPAGWGQGLGPGGIAWAVMGGVIPIGEIW